MTSSHSISACTQTVADFVQTPLLALEPVGSPQLPLQRPEDQSVFDTACTNTTPRTAPSGLPVGRAAQQQPLTFSTSCKVALLSTPRIFCASSSVIPLAFAAAFTLSGVTPDFCASAQGTHTDAHHPGRLQLHSLATHAGGPAAGRTDKRLPVRLGAGPQQHARARNYQVCQDAGGLRADIWFRESAECPHAACTTALCNLRRGCWQHGRTMNGCAGAASPASPPALRLKHGQTHTGGYVYYPRNLWQLLVTGGGSFLGSQARLAPRQIPSKGSNLSRAPK